MEAAARSIRDAISRGVPLFNSGNVSECYSVYQSTASEILQKVGTQLNDVHRSLLSNALERAQSQSAKDAAWTMRHAFDEILLSAQVETFSLLRSSSGAQIRSSGSPVRVTTENANSIRWWIVNDTVMGGRSSSQVNIHPETGTVVFSGLVTKAGGGGFASVRGSMTSGDGFHWDGYDGVELEFRGDGNRYKFQIKADNAMDGVMYQSDFSSKPDLASSEWERVRLPLSGFVPSFRGQRLDNAPLVTGGRVRSIGLMLSFLTDLGYPNPQFRQGPFSLTVKSILPYKNDS
mmetsp:Transcript_25179/g.41431  ORF Transcript_25179/g.41431 Transcript_25179/m.41431 type:complete len:290 (-) Transcript_25179:550-1419(-)|eukprot:CAMPEP_0184650820 /NCGR_PEP_ID=MMETSP0308-20130426/8393_1 /TAXON_ID=38269 /ORGANISM="Gloeochaete witrockiana, Strain SAG 46.84" /LENGTH=289 /DNA_ID=CAMNT_0027084623 /DNA_START=23 /DNA_END=892 /DNA_ORIENTATION=+